MLKVSVIGMGNLGVPIACSIAKHGDCEVIGIDTNQEIVDMINRGTSPTMECDGVLPELVSNGKLSASSLYTSVADTDITIIIVGTPSNPDGSFSIAQVEKAITSTGLAVRDKVQAGNYHLVVVLSTLMPGHGRQLVAALENATGMLYDSGSYGFVYNPELVAIGTVSRDFLAPDVIVVGEAKQEDPAAERWTSFYRDCVIANAHVHEYWPTAVMSLESAELFKLWLNTIVAGKISIANAIAAMCEAISGADAIDVTDALGYDRRIGHRFLRPGMGYGGTCFPRDIPAMQYAMSKTDIDLDYFLVPMAVDCVNEQTHKRIMRHIQRYVQPGDTVAVLGVAFKHGVGIVTGSQSCRLIEELIDYGYNVSVYDPYVKDDDIPAGARRYKTAQGCITRANVVVLADMESLELRGLSYEENQVVVDVWRALDDVDNVSAKVISLGKGE